MDNNESNKLKKYFDDGIGIIITKPGNKSSLQSATESIKQNSHSFEDGYLEIRKENGIVVNGSAIQYDPKIRWEKQQKQDSSYLEDVTNFIKLNYNCPDSEKVGSGPGSCGGNKPDNNKNNNDQEFNIIKVSGMPYSRIHVQEEIPNSLVTYISNKLSESKLNIDLLDISPTIGLIGAQGMTMANISGDTPNNLTFKIDGLFIDSKIFSDSYYNEAMDKKESHLTKYGKLPVLSSDAASKEELIKMVQDHEIGHLLLQKYRYNKMKNSEIDINSENIKSDPEWKTIAATEWKNGFESTTHGDSSSEELFAEAYCAVENNRENMFPKSMIDFVKKVKLGVI